MSENIYINEVHKRDVVLLKHALSELHAAIEEMKLSVYPHVPLPRPKLIKFTKSITWPYMREDGYLLFDAVYVRKGNTIEYIWNDSCFERIARKCLESHPSPGGAFSILHRIRAATEWCRARAKGRRRAAQEILRQQKKISEALDAETALYSLSS